MKAEPLKGKILHETIQDNKANWRNIIYIEDVESAVQWLKEELYNHFADNYNQERTEKIIDKAFEDVVKK